MKRVIQLVQVAFMGLCSGWVGVIAAVHYTKSGPTVSVVLTAVALMLAGMTYGLWKEYRDTRR